MRRMQEEQKRAEQRKEAAKASNGTPFRFYVPVGETREIIIIDEEPDFFRSEHTLKNPASGRFDLVVPCIDEHANCPACAVSDKPSYFAMYLSVIDLTPYVNRQDEEVEFSKKLLVVKLTQQKKITRLLEQHGTLRGMKLAMTRDGDKDAAIGNDIDFIEFVDEEELEEYIYDYEDREGKVVEVDCTEPYDYEEIFPDLSEKQIRALVGGKGSDDDDDRGSRRGSSRRNSRDDDDDADDDAPPPRRGSRTSSREEAAPRRAGSRRQREEEPEEEQEEEEERRPRRTASRQVAEDAAPRSGSRRGSRPAADDEAEEEAPAPRRAGRRASREEEPEEAAPRAADRQARRATLRGRR